MKSLIKQTLKRLVGVAFEQLLLESNREVLREVLSGQISRSQETQILLMLHYKDLVRRNIRPLPTFDEVGFRCHSQFEEDGILLYIFSLVGTTAKVAVEICAGDGTECNTTNLILNHGWNGFLFDGNPRLVEKGKDFFSKHKDTFLWPPQFNHAWITAENVNKVVRDAGTSGEIDLLSLDIDGMDYWIWKALDCIEPRVVVCETHNVIGPDKPLTVPYDPNFKIQIPDYRSASLAAMAKLASQKGYRLVGAHRYGFNAFFLRNGIGDDLLPSVPVSSCLLHPSAQHAMRETWPKVKDLQWVEV
jgi:hypothetical protein